MNKAVILKKNSEIQRSDITLTLDVASALVHMILSGQTIHPKSGLIEYYSVSNEGEETLVKIKVNTVMSWVKRDNVIPETGETLRDVLDRARQTYRTEKEEKKRGKLISDAERVLKRTLNLQTNKPAIGMFGVIKDKEGNVVKKEDTKLLKIKVDVAKYVTERLKSDKWGKIEKSENKHLVAFSLADLRKAKQEKEEEVTT